MDVLENTIFHNNIILRQIFKHLPPDDIKTATLICRKWKQELEFPMFWNWTVANIEAEDVEFVRKSKRIRLVENIKIRTKFTGSSAALSQLLELTQSSPDWRLTVLDLSSLNLFPVSS